MNATFAIYPKIFPLQTYFDTTNLEKAILVQSRGSGIVAPDKQPDVKGTFVGLTPDSQTPIAFRPISVDKRVGGQTIVLVPGQVVRVDISGFEWGIPYGWLGGGLATLVVAGNDQAFIGWPTAKVEVLLQRFRAIIQADGAPAGLTFKICLPNRFPWPNAQRLFVGILTSQAGQPVLAPEPTRVAIRLRLNNLAAPADMRIIVKSLDDLDIGADGLTPGAADYTAVDVSFPMQPAALAAVAFPVIEVNMPARLGGDLAAMALVDMTGTLAGAYVDILRYGKI